MARGCLAVEVTEFSRGILACVQPRHEGPSRMAVLPLGEVINLAVNDDPAVLEGVVLLEFLSGHQAIARRGHARFPQVHRDHPTRLSTRTRRPVIPRSPPPRRKPVPDLAGVELIDPGVVIARAFFVVEEREVSFIHGSQDLLALS